MKYKKGNILNLIEALYLFLVALIKAGIYLINPFTKSNFKTKLYYIREGMRLT